MIILNRYIELLWLWSTIIIIGSHVILTNGATHATKLRKLQDTPASTTTSPVEIMDATMAFIKSSESTFDHEIRLTDNLSFHWNDVQGGDRFQGRLIHHSDSIDQAPTWLGVGVYHSNHNYTQLPTETSSFMVGSDAIIGIVSTNEVTKYHLGGRELSDTGVRKIDSSSLSGTMIIQHDADDGTVTTDLTFTKVLDETNPEEARIRRSGVNVFMWATGAPGVFSGLSHHTERGAFYLDFAKVEAMVEKDSAEKFPEADKPTAPPPSENVAPVIRGKCGSSLIDGGAQVALTPTLTFHWQLLPSVNKVKLALENRGREVWIGLAASRDGKMIGSSTVVGVPEDNSVRQYTLTDQDIGGLEPVPLPNLEDESFSSEQVNGAEYTTILSFTKRLHDGSDQVSIEKDGTNTFLYAVGNTKELAYHEHRGAFQMEFLDCGEGIDIDQLIWTNAGTMAAHGFFAFVAWGLASPFAVTVAWFRTMVPASWIYIHVFANALGFIFTFITFWIAVGGVGQEKTASHFTKTHHFGGLVMMFLVVVQIVNGFLRPPVERKDSRQQQQQNALPRDTLFGIIPIPKSPRESWQFLHRMIGISLIVLGIYQIQSGLSLYSKNFQTKSMVKYYYFYVGIFFLSLVGLKIWATTEEDRARKGVVQAVSTTEPSEDQVSPPPPPPLQGAMA